MSDKGAESGRPLEDPKLKDLQGLIRKSFRVRGNKTPIYVDLGGNLDRVALEQHQIVFGRRGSGKSCLLIFFRRVKAPTDKIHTVYILADDIKTLDYPDVLIRLLLAVFENLPSRSWRSRLWRRIRRARSSTDDIVKELRDLLQQASASRLKVTTGRATSSTTDAKVQLKAGPAQASAGLKADEKLSSEEVRESDDVKIRHVENRLTDFKIAIQEEFAGANQPWGAFIIDDFYLINPQWHPEVLDYLHRLLRDTDLYLKVGTVRHRTRLLKTTPIQVGVQVHQDVDGFNLDQTLEDIDQTAGYLEDMLRKMGEKVGFDDAVTVMTEDARKDLVLLSGGVPRDYLNIFVGGLERAHQRRDARQVTPTDLRRAAAALSQETKLRDLRTDAGSEVPALETLFVDLVKFCLEEKRKTAFLVAKEQIGGFPEVHELIQQLMDFKLIHLVEPSTSAASGRPGRYEAYTLDFSLFMEPRRRNIEIVRFWETDNQRRRVRLREAPTYDLERGDNAIKGDSAQAEEALEVVSNLAPAAETEELTLFGTSASGE